MLVFFLHQTGENPIINEVSGMSVLTGKIIFFIRRLTVRQVSIINVSVLTTLVFQVFCFAIVYYFLVDTEFFKDNHNLLHGP